MFPPLPSRKGLAPKKLKQQLPAATATAKFDNGLKKKTLGFKSVSELNVQKAVTTYGAAYGVANSGLLDASESISFVPNVQEAPDIVTVAAYEAAYCVLVNANNNISNATGLAPKKQNPQVPSAKVIAKIDTGSKKKTLGFKSVSELNVQKAVTTYSAAYGVANSGLLDASENISNSAGLAPKKQNPQVPSAKVIAKIDTGSKKKTLGFKSVSELNVQKAVTTYGATYGVANSGLLDASENISNSAGLAPKKQKSKVPYAKVTAKIDTGLKKKTLGFKPVSELNVQKAVTTNDASEVASSGLSEEMDNISATSAGTYTKEDADSVLADASKNISAAAGLAPKKLKSPLPSTKATAKTDIGMKNNTLKCKSFYVPRVQEAAGLKKIISNPKAVGVPSVQKVVEMNGAASRVANSGSRIARENISLVPNVQEAPDVVNVAATEVANYALLDAKNNISNAAAWKNQKSPSQYAKKGAKVDTDIYNNTLKSKYFYVPLVQEAALHECKSTSAIAVGNRKSRSPLAPDQEFITAKYPVRKEIAARKELRSELTFTEKKNVVAEKMVSGAIKQPVKVVEQNGAMNVNDLIMELEMLQRQIYNIYSNDEIPKEQKPYKSIAFLSMVTDNECKLRLEDVCFFELPKKLPVNSLNDLQRKIDLEMDRCLDTMHDSMRTLCSSYSAMPEELLKEFQKKSNEDKDKFSSDIKNLLRSYFDVDANASDEKNKLEELVMKFEDFIRDTKKNAQDFADKEARRENLLKIELNQEKHHRAKLQLWYTDVLEEIEKIGNLLESSQNLERKNSHMLGSYEKILEELKLLKQQISDLEFEKQFYQQFYINEFLKIRDAVIEKLNIINSHDEHNAKTDSEIELVKNLCAQLHSQNEFSKELANDLIIIRESLERNPQVDLKEEIFKTIKHEMKLIGENLESVLEKLMKNCAREKEDIQEKLDAAADTIQCQDMKINQLKDTIANMMTQKYELELKVAHAEKEAANREALLSARNTVIEHLEQSNSYLEHRLQQIQSAPKDDNNESSDYLLNYHHFLEMRKEKSRRTIKVKKYDI